ncbi:MAG: glutamine synthetase family protein [Solirubrobacterales bacterium]
MSGLGDARFVALGIADLNGSIRGKALSPAAFEAAVAEGTAMTNLMLAVDPVDAPIETYETIGLCSGAADLIARPDTETLGELRWRPGWMACLADLCWADGSTCELAPRNALRRALAEMRSVGYEVLAAFEYEIRLLDEDGRPPFADISYSVAEIAGLDAFLERLHSGLEGLGVGLAAVHTEAGPGLLEINLDAREGLRAADDAALVKLAVKEIAASFGWRASFLAKTAPGEEGSSGHIHLSCWADGENAFAGEAGALSPVAAGAIAGMLQHMPAASLLLNPTINSYKRLVPGWFAPVNATWGFDNRSAALRLIAGSRPGRSRVECRRPGADANPYLALAALVASAAKGIREGATPPEPVSGDAAEQADAPSLPASLESALSAFRADTALHAALGSELSAHFEVSREWELRAWQQSVSDWERARYEAAV